MLRARRLPCSVIRTPDSISIHETTTAPSELPATLDTLLPACARPCILAFIADNYSATQSTDLQALCTINTRSRFTLGEAALICQAAYCSTAIQSDKSVFSICEGTPRAIRPTHESLIAVSMAASQLAPGSDAFASALPPSIDAPATINVDVTEIASATGVPPTPLSSSSPSSPPSSSSLTPQTSSTSTSTPGSSDAATTTPRAELDAILTPSSTPVAEAPSSRAQGRLSTEQIVGISLAAFAVLAFFFGLLVFLFYRRKRRSRPRRPSRWSVLGKEDPASFPPGESPLAKTISNAGATTTDHGQRFYAPRTTHQEKRRSFWRRSIKPEDIGVAVSPEIGQPVSPISASSQRTTSQLLPELPNHSLWSWAPRKPQNRSQTAGHRQEPLKEKVRFPSTFVQPRAADKPERIVSSRTGNGLPTDPRAQMCLLRDSRGANDRIPLTPVYDNGNVPMTFGSLPMTREESPPCYHYSSPSSQGPNSNSYLQSTELVYKSPTEPPLMAQREISRSFQGPLLRRNSSSSDCTNIEEDDDVAPEQEEKRQLQGAPLSPVIESPGTPGKTFSYPPRPRSAAIRKQAEIKPKPQPQLADNASGQASSKPGDLARSPPKGPNLLRNASSHVNKSLSTSKATPPRRDRHLGPAFSPTKCNNSREADHQQHQGLRLNPAGANAQPWRKRHVYHPKDVAEQGQSRRGSDTENNVVNIGIKTLSSSPPPPLTPPKPKPTPPPKDLQSPVTLRLTPTRRGEDLYLTID